MARNEEKQLARLNRYYLQKQKEEELKKRPPRPKLESLTTVEELKKWLPSVTRDIDFYLKQMEVPCYQDKQIEEFSQRIAQLKGEYKAYMRKLRELNPEDRIVPWTDRPYTMKRQKISSSHDIDSKEKGDCDTDSDEEPSESQLPPRFTPLSTPVLDNDEENIQNFGYEKPVAANCPDLLDESMNKPLQFAPVINPRKDTDRQAEYKADSMSLKQSSKSMETCHKSQPIEISGVLNLPYSDSSSSGDET